MSKAKSGIPVRQQFLHVALLMRAACSSADTSAPAEASVRASVPWSRFPSLRAEGEAIQNGAAESGLLRRFAPRNDGEHGVAVPDLRQRRRT
jgi:hypothetical protein